jgi:hypothetical protein
MIQQGSRDMDDERRRCAFEGSWRTMTDPDTFAEWEAREREGWLYISDWGPAIQRGWYCPPHAKVLNELEESGELDHIQSKAR